MTLINIKQNPPIAYFNFFAVVRKYAKYLYYLYVFVLTHRYNYWYRKREYTDGSWKRGPC